MQKSKADCSLFMTNCTLMASNTWILTNMSTFYTFTFGTFSLCIFSQISSIRSKTLLLIPVDIFNLKRP